MRRFISTNLYICGEKKGRLFLFQTEKGKKRKTFIGFFKKRKALDNKKSGAFPAGAKGEGGLVFRKVSHCQKSSPRKRK